MPFQSVTLGPYSQKKSRQVIIKEKVPIEFFDVLFNQNFRESSDRGGQYETCTSRHLAIGNLSNDDGHGNENVT